MGIAARLARPAVWRRLTAAAAALMAVAAAVLVAAGRADAGPCAIAGACLRIAQLAPPTPHPSGILGPNDQREQIASDRWPWSSIGRLNILFGPSYRGVCTGTLIGPRQVVTAAHCLFNSRVNDWAKPESIHFVIGQTGDKFSGHAVVESFAVSPRFRFKMEDRPRYDFIAADMIRHDWAILTLREPLAGKPVPIRAYRDAELPAPESGATVALAGYAQDHQYVLSVHNGCSAKIDWPDAGAITHRCDAAHGESGGPILLLHGDEAELIGIHSADTQRFESQVGYQAVAGRGVSAAGFAPAAAEAGVPAH